MRSNFVTKLHLIAYLHLKNKSCFRKIELDFRVQRVWSKFNTTIDFFWAINNNDFKIEYYRSPNILCVQSSQTTSTNCILDLIQTTCSPHDTSNQNRQGRKSGCKGAKMDE